MTDAEISKMTPAEARAHILEVLESASELIAPLFPEMRKKPLIGGSFGSAGFLLTSSCHTERGLHSVRYYVFSEHGLMLGFGATRAEAIHVARDILSHMEPAKATAMLAQFRAKKDRQKAELVARMRDEEIEQSQRRGKSAEVRSIPRRRQRIFDECGGKCHYCATPLTLDGKWHIEHKMPRALGGGNEPGNLVAACAPCNHEKRDQTDLEYIAKRAKKEQA